MSGSHWDIGGPEPQPGDFDEDLEKIKPEDIQVLEASPERSLALQVIVRGHAMDALVRVADARGQSIDVVVADLVLAAAETTPVRR
jgi:hypothetical protein